VPEPGLPVVVEEVTAERVPDDSSPVATPVLEAGVAGVATANGWRSRVRGRRRAEVERLPGPGALGSPVVEVDDGVAD
jgi:hypothetical protein